MECLCLWSSSHLFHLFLTLFFTFITPSFPPFLITLNHSPFPPQTLTVICGIHTYSPMEAKNFEGRQGWKEKVNKDVEEVEDDSDEEETGAGGGLMVRFEESEKQKKGAAGKKGSGAGGVQPCCQADRCGADLVDAKRYHRRHKVCEFHSKAPVVMVSGLRQRFCQQCSRFHELTEFDEAKRSCRRRLAGHNERRRKSSGDPYAEGSSRKGVGNQLKESQATYQITPPGHSASKHLQIR